MGNHIQRGFHLPPSRLGGRAPLLIVRLGLPLTLFALRRRARPTDALLLLALLMLLRPVRRAARSAPLLSRAPAVPS